MKIFYDNFADDSTLSATTETDGYPVENVQDIHLSTKWRTTTAASGQAIVFNYGSAFNPKGMIVAGTNMRTGSTIQFQANSSDSWPGAIGTTALTDLGNGVWYHANSGGLGSYQYWRYVFTDVGNPDGYLEAGRCYIGDEIVVNSPSKSFTEEINDTSNISFSRSGQVYGDIGYRYKTYNCNFPYWTNTMKDDIETFLDATIGGEPFFVAFDPSNNDKLPTIYAIAEPGVKYNNKISLTKWDGSLTFREVF